MTHAPASESADRVAEAATGRDAVDRSTGRTLVIWNPDAGGDGGEVEQRRDELRAALARHGIDAEIFESQSESDARRRVQQGLLERVPTIVAAGGDGTVRSIAFQLLGQDVALGILPGGTAMNVARSLGIPLELDAAAAVLAAGHVRRMDIGEVRGQPFLEIASIGLGAEVLAGATHVSEGRFRAALGLLRSGLRNRRTRVRLQLDGREVRTRALSIAVANGRFTGRGMELAPEASLDDGRFDVLVFEGFGPLGLGAHLARVLLGRPHDERISRYTASTVRVSTHRPLPIRVDSQDVGITPASLVTRRAGLRVIAPGSTS
jgi:diacylglycerol kinase (ATP)